MAGKIGKDLEFSSRSPKLSRHQLENSVSVLKDEIRRLHKENLQVRTDLKLERAKALDLKYALQEKEEELEQHQRDYDREMKDIISKLLLLEADFRKEKQEITRLIAAKDATIESLNNELSSKNSLIESLRRKVESLQQSHDKDDRNKLDKKMEAQKLEIDKLRNANARLLESLSHVRLNHPNTHHKGKLRRSSTPASRGHGKSHLGNSELSEWKEELSAFF